MHTIKGFSFNIAKSVDITDRSRVSFHLMGITCYVGYPFHEYRHTCKVNVNWLMDFHIFCLMEIYQFTRNRTEIQLWITIRIHKRALVERSCIKIHLQFISTENSRRTWFVLTLRESENLWRQSAHDACWRCALMFSPKVTAA